MFPPYYQRVTGLDVDWYFCLGRITFGYYGIFRKKSEEDLEKIKSGN
jgi:hypothetical protein